MVRLDLFSNGQSAVICLNVEKLIVSLHRDDNNVLCYMSYDSHWSATLPKIINFLYKRTHDKRVYERQQRLYLLSVRQGQNIGTPVPFNGVRNISLFPLVLWLLHTRDKFIMLSHGYLISSHTVFSSSAGPHCPVINGHMSAFHLGTVIRRVLSRMFMSVTVSSIYWFKRAVKRVGIYSMRVERMFGS